MKIILGSSSKYRRQILTDHGYEFEVMSPDVDEKSIRTEDPHDLPLTLARMKAQVLQENIVEPVLVITCDTVAICNGKLREKPVSEEELRMFLQEYEQYPAEVVGAVVVTNTLTGKQVSSVDVAKVYFKPMTQEQINLYIEIGDPYSRAGGFAIQHPAFTPYVERFEGDKEGIIGINVDTVSRLLKEAQE